MGTQIMADHNNFFLFWTVLSFILIGITVTVDRPAPFAPFHMTFAPKKKAHLRLKVAPVCALFK